ASVTPSTETDAFCGTVTPALSGSTPASKDGLVAPRPVINSVRNSFGLAGVKVTPGRRSGAPMNAKVWPSLAAMGFLPSILGLKEKNSGEAAIIGTDAALLLASACPQLAMTWTEIGPRSARVGTWTLIWRSVRKNMRPSVLPNCTQTPPRLVGNLPSTRSAAPTERTVPAGAKFWPNKLTMAFGESCFTAGVL